MLPKIDYPLFTITDPISKKKLKFRPALVKDQKLLLLAKESGENKDILAAIKQIVNNCLVDDSDIDEFPIVLLEYCYIKIQAQSVSNIMKFYQKDDEDGKNHELEVDLNKVEMFFPETYKAKDNNIIKLTDNLALIMKYPVAKLYEDDEFLDAKNYIYELIVRCVDSVAKDDEVFPTKGEKLEDIKAFVDQLDGKSFKKIEDFIYSQPIIRHEVKYKNDKGNERTVVLNNLADFFVLF